MGTEYLLTISTFNALSLKMAQGMWVMRGTGARYLRPENDKWGVYIFILSITHTL